MKNVRKDEANEKQPQFQRVGTIDGKPLVRVYFNHSEEEREDVSNEEEGKTHTVYLADFIERKSKLTDATEVAKEELLEQIDTYDTSPAVNSFTLGGKEMWLPKETRVGLVNSITIEKAAGKETTVLWFDGEKYELPVDTALQMLSALELYALDCYNVTAAHKAAVSALVSVEDIVAYDYIANYPSKLNF
ncbi:MAG: DUF4376 domain-containing protein [Prevotella sp.]